MQELQALENKLHLYGLKLFAFKEPDIGNELTAICVEPSELTEKLTKKLKLL